ncbi:MAG: hypothetical protein R3F14_11560 [Polyangiaceae bacterium]
MSGEVLDKRGTALRDAIAVVDAGKAPPCRSCLTAAAAKLAAGDAGDDAAKVEIDDIDLDADEAAGKCSARATAAARPRSTRRRWAPTIRCRTRATLAAASTEPS